MYDILIYFSNSVYLQLLSWLRSDSLVLVCKVTPPPMHTVTNQPAIMSRIIRWNYNIKSFLIVLSWLGIDASSVLLHRRASLRIAESWFVLFAVTWFRVARFSCCSILAPYCCIQAPYSYIQAPYCCIQAPYSCIQAPYYWIQDP